MRSKGVRLSATVPLDIVGSLGLLPGKRYTLQLQGGTLARVYLSAEAGESAPDIAAVEADPTGTEAKPRAMEMRPGPTAAVSTGTGPKFAPIWVWDEGEGVLAVSEDVD